MREQYKAAQMVSMQEQSHRKQSLIGRLFPKRKGKHKTDITPPSTVGMVSNHISFLGLDANYI